MYPQPVLTAEEQTIIFRIRQLISDTVEPFVDDVPNVDSCSLVSASGTMYQLEEPKGYPTEVYVNGTEYTASGNPTVVGYKFLKFASSILVSGANMTIIYNHFRHSDLEIIDTYDTSAMTFLVTQCNLEPEDLGQDLLILSTAYILLSKDMSTFIGSAIEIQDSDSRYSSSSRATAMKDYLKNISDLLRDAVKAKSNCKMFSLPVYKVE